MLGRLMLFFGQDVGGGIQKLEDIRWATIVWAEEDRKRKSGNLASKMMVSSVKRSRTADENMLDIIGLIPLSEIWVKDTGASCFLAW